MQKRVSLTVPYHAQPDSSSYCSAACSQMVLEFHGQKQTLPQLVKEIGVATVPGSSFYNDPATAPKSVRFCFSKRDETLFEADRRLARISVGKF